MLLTAIVVFVALDGFRIPVLLWMLWENEPTSAKLPSEEVEAAPVLVVPWPAIALPAGPLPRLRRADLEDFFFPEGVDDPDHGVVTRKFMQGPLALRNSGDKGGGYLLSFYRMLRNKVRGLPTAYDKYGDDMPEGERARDPELTVYSAWKLLKPEHRSFAAKPLGPIGARMYAQGCSADHFYRQGPYPREGKAPLAPREAYALEGGFVAIKHRLGEPTVDHCLFKGLLVALGLHPTEAFFFKAGPLSPEEQARALAALALLYHPAVEPGMEEAAFVRLLLEKGLIDP